MMQHDCTMRMAHNWVIGMCENVDPVVYVQYVTDKCDLERSSQQYAGTCAK